MDKNTAQKLEKDLANEKLIYDKLNQLHSRSQDRDDFVEEARLLIELEAQHLRVAEAEDKAKSLKSPSGGEARQSSGKSDSEGGSGNPGGPCSGASEGGSPSDSNSGEGGKDVSSSKEISVDNF